MYCSAFATLAVIWLVDMALDPRQVDLNGYKCSKSAYFLTEKALRVPRAFPIVAQIDSIEPWKSPPGSSMALLGVLRTCHYPDPEKLCLIG